MQVDYRARFLKLKMAYQNFLFDLVLKRREGKPLAISASKLHKNIVEALSYELFFYDKHGVIGETYLLDGYFLEGDTITIFPNTDFLDTVDLILRDKEAAKQKLREVEIEENTPNILRGGIC